MGKTVLKFLLSCFSPIALLAQFEPVRNFSVKDGLPSGVVYDCLQDKQGFMWFATAAGLARFDGTNFRVFTTENGLTNNEVLQIALDKDGSIWIFPFGATACIYDPISQKLYNENNYHELRKLRNPSLQLLVRNSEAGLIAFAGNNTFFLENKRMEELDTRGIHDLWPLTRDSIIFMGVLQKFYLMTGRKKIDINLAIPDSSLVFGKAISWGRWKIFINSGTTTKFNLYEFTNEGSIKKRADFSSKYPINNISKFGSTIYLATVSGVYVTDTMLVTKEYFFPGKNISRVFIDKNENEWLCSLSGEGVYMRLKNAVKQYDISSGLPDDNVRALKMIQDNKLLCGDDKGNIYTIDPAAKSVNQVHSGKLPEAIRSIERYGNSVIIYSNYKMLIDDKEIAWNFGAIKCVLPDSNGNLLIGSHWYLQVYNISKNQNERIKGAQRFGALSYSQGNLYYGNNNGLFKIQSLRPYTESLVDSKSNVLNKPINHLYSSSDGILWVATNTDGIVAVKNDKMIGHFSTSSSQSLTSNICKKIFFDKESNSIWAVTNKGLNKISYTLSGDSINAAINSVTSSEGLNDDDVNDVYVKDQKVYAATIKGICIFNTDLVKEEVPIRVTDVFIKDYSSPDSTNSVRSNYDLKYWQNNISISYTGMCFTCNKKLIYQYRMIGVSKDTSWKTTTANTVEFGELQKGNYTFQVRTDQGNIQELTFYIEPAFWQTNLFYVLIVLGVIGFFFFTIRFIARQIRKRELEKTAINKKFAELEFQALQAQMNPHFVFNAMNTLQNYILKNESENASEYLARFARLMRLFLEASRNKFIELSNEIELLRNYIELEQARLQHNFHYLITIEPDVKMDMKIPSVIIQPFVENAILHGLRHKNDNSGLLKLYFSVQNHALECRIEDNGIGRKESEIINKTKDKLYKSQAIQIIDEKVKTLKEINNIDIHITIDDKTWDDGRASGTTVTILFDGDK